MPGDDAPKPARPPDDMEVAVQAERTLWENAITYYAHRAGVEYLQLSAGQILEKMADELCRLKGIGPYKNEHREE
jgi:hypothetical protein